MASNRTFKEEWHADPNAIGSTAIWMIMCTVGLKITKENGFIQIKMLVLLNITAIVQGLRNRYNDYN